MAQSLSSLDVHLIFSTKGRNPWIDDGVRKEMHGFMVRGLQGNGCLVKAINSVDDHVHVLFDLSRSWSVKDIVQAIKAPSSLWMKQQGAQYAQFTWQAGYGAFAVSRSNVEKVVTYIESQAEHHKSVSFQDEFRLFLERHEVEYDERYVWD
jgi:putative transposase